MAKNKEKFDVRKYINWILLLVACILICLIASKLYNIYQDSKLDSSVLSRVVGTIQYEDIENTLQELAGEDFILISYTESKEVHNLEVNLKTAIVDNDLQSNFYYLDATDLMLEQDYITTLNDIFSLSGKNEIEALPALLYYKNGEFVKTLSSTEDTMLSVDDFYKLLDSYEIVDSND